MSVILPPPDVRVIVDKTAAFVAKNGREFEERIMEHERHNTKFAFLNPNDPYHAYYQKRVQEFVEGGPDSIAKATAEAKLESPGSAVTKPVEEPLRVPLREPEPLEFIAEIPLISSLDLDVMKLAAQFVAKNGKQFMLNLSQREQRNPQFDFLKPTHSLYHYFNKLVEQYSKVITPPKTLPAKLELYSNAKHQLLEKIVERVEYSRYQAEQQRRAEVEADRERAAYAMIDWHDFIVADTIEFGPKDKTVELPKPLDLSALMSMSIVQRQELWGGKLISASSAMQEDQEQEMEMEIEDTQMPPKKRPATDSMSLYPPLTTIQLPTAGVFGGEQESIKVRYDYVPKAVSQQQPTKDASGPIQICSICQMPVPSSQIEEHMRIELLDPRWREQRRANLEKHRESNIVESGVDVSRNLSMLSRTRTDIFGRQETEIGRKFGEDKEAAKHGERQKVVWDGYVDSAPLATRAAQMIAKPQILEEMAALQQAGDVSIDPKSGIGPRLSQPQVPTQPYRGSQK